MLYFGGILRDTIAFVNFLMSSPVFALILANGTSSRFGGDKLISAVDSGISVLEKTLSAYDRHPEISGVFIVGEHKQEHDHFFQTYTKFSGYIAGGETRYKSFCAGIDFLNQKNKLGNHIKILVHNGANPFVSDAEISGVCREITQSTAVGVGRKMTNTLRKWNTELSVSEVIPRETVYAMETPQGALLSDFSRWKDVENQKTQNLDMAKISEITDELMLAEQQGAKTIIIPASPANTKITYQQDLEKNMNTETHTQVFPITGFGVDSHRFASDDLGECKLCGIVIENSPKFSGNSDADVALHALCNAILSGIGKNSFSAVADDLCQQGEKNSGVYLQKILEMMEAEGKKILHLVLSFEGKRPKIEKYFPQFRENLSRILHIPQSCIGLNATTGEELDGCGRGEGMKVSAVVTMV